MALLNQLFTAITSGAAPVNPGIGGWDALINQFMSDRRGRHGFGLLSRMVSVTPTTQSEHTILVTASEGWSAMPLFVAVKREGNTPTNSYNLRVHTGINWNTGVSFAALSDNDSLLLVWPEPGAGIFTANSPQNIPYLDGDVDTRNTFRVQRISTPAVPLTFFTYGFAWQNSD